MIDSLFRRSILSISDICGNYQKGNYYPHHAVLIRGKSKLLFNEIIKKAASEEAALNGPWIIAADCSGLAMSFPLQIVLRTRELLTVTFKIFLVLERL